MRYLIIIAALFGCEVRDQDDAKPDSGTVDDCKAACDNLRGMNCEAGIGSPGQDEVYGTDDDVPCETVCRDFMMPPASLHPGCVAQAKSCNEADRCFE